MVYADNSFYLNCYQATVTAKGQVTFGPTIVPVKGVIPDPWPAGCLPNGVAAPQAVNNAQVGLTPGDLILMTLNGTQVVGEVTAGAIAMGANVKGATYTVLFADGDPLKMNQTGAGTGTEQHREGRYRIKSSAPSRHHLLPRQHGQPGATDAADQWTYTDADNRRRGLHEVQL